ncbi:hypothetical protein [Shimia sp.]|uniref:hypothetical protein n=1 Tax=Shimia sp. TaxID=1954381 RepID=UPI003B8E6E47
MAMLQSSVIFVFLACYVPIVHWLYVVPFPPLVAMIWGNVVLSSLSQSNLLGVSAITLVLLCGVWGFATQNLAIFQRVLFRVALFPVFGVLALILTISATQFAAQRQIDKAGTRQDAECVSLLDLRRSVSQLFDPYGRAPHAIALIDGQVLTYSFEEDQFLVQGWVAKLAPPFDDRCRANRD